MLSTILRTVRREFHIHAPDRAAHDVLAFIRARPEVEGPAPLRVDIAVERIHGFLRMEARAGAPVEGSADHLLADLHGLHFETTCAEHPGAPLIHAGTVSTDDGHVVLVGDKGVGKTTLLVYLATQGWPIAGDEHIVVEGGAGIPRPRSLRVKAGALRYLDADAAALIAGSPSIKDWLGAAVYAVQPSAFGRPWVIRSQPIRHLVFLQANHGGRSRLRRLDRDRSLERLLQNVLLPPTGKALALGALRSLVSTAQCWELWNGRLEDSQGILYQFIAGRA